MGLLDWSIKKKMCKVTSKQSEDTSIDKSTARSHPSRKAHPVLTYPVVISLMITLLIRQQRHS